MSAKHSDGFYAGRFYPWWLERPLWQRAWCWLAFHVFMVLPLSRGRGLYDRFSTRLYTSHSMPTP